MGLDLDFEDGTVLGAGKVGEGLTARGTALLVRRHRMLCDAGGQRALVPAAVSGLSRLLSATAATLLGVGSRGGVRRSDGVRGGLHGRGGRGAVSAGVVVVVVSAGS